MSAHPYSSYWGKVGQSQTPHLLYYHCLDVAAAGAALLEQHPTLLAFFKQRLGVQDDNVVKAWLVFWLILHDIGKFSNTFQGLREGTVEAFDRYRVRHDSLGMWLWCKYLQDKLTGGSQDWDWLDRYEAATTVWAKAATGHHGKPPQNAQPIQEFFSSEDKHAAWAFVCDVLSFIEAEFKVSFAQAFAALEQASDSFENTSKVLSWWFSGFVILADWLGSNATYFPYRNDFDAPLSMQEYWERYAAPQAKKALEKSGLLAQPLRVAQALSDIFPFIAEPSPLQHWAAHVDIAAGSQLYLLEDVTGAGKTEAAVMLLHRLLAAGVAHGFFVALPTVATANAMYARIAQLYRLLFAGDASLVLASGQRQLVEEFARTVLPAVEQAEREYRADPRGAEDDLSASARCSAWLADHLKRALLAPAGVGTIDQVLLAILYSKHQSLRLLGLQGKVLIVDEVHAAGHDGYMTTLLKILLEAHARAGGSVILLSATLPQQMKTELLESFAKGCGYALPRTDLQSQLDEAYPLVTAWQSVHPERLLQTPIATRPDVQRTVAVRYQDDENGVHAAILAALEAGRCVCWIRNTVADALAAHQHFQSRLPPERLTLFHARFTLHDRLRIEGDVLARFGKTSTADARRGQLVIATQVVEQSLDADFDLMVSDLAPIDRLIQRAGRLQRHRRDAHGNPLADPAAPDRRGAPTLIVFGPPWTTAPAADWYKAVFAKAAAVYEHVGQLWRTAQCLQSGAFTMPEDARRLIEAVFADSDNLPEALRKNALTVQGNEYGDRSIAQQNTIALECGYSLDGQIDWWSEMNTPTRLGEASIEVRLACWQVQADGTPCLQALHADARPQHAWAYSTLRVRQALLHQVPEPTDSAHAQAYQAAQQTLPDKGRWSVLLPLEAQADGSFIGYARNQQGKRHRWCYHPQSGLQDEGEA